MKQGWEIKKLGDVCTIERGGSPRPIDAYITDEDNGINWIKIGDATPNSKYITSTKEKIKPEGIRKSRMVYKGDFILSNSMSFGRPYILGVDGCIHDGWLVLRDNENTFDKIFLYYYLSSPFIYQEFKRLAVGGVVNNLNSELVRGVNVIVPPIAEQEKIVAELDCLSGIIEKKEQQLKELDNLAQSIFYEMFSNQDGTPVKLSQACSVVSGLVNPNDEPYCNYPHIGGANIESHTGKFLNVKLAKEENLISGKYPFDDTMILYSKIRPNLNKVALPSFKGICSADMYPLIPQNEFNKVFLKYILTQKVFLDYAISHSGRANIPKINREDLLNYEFLTYPITLQQDFASKIESIEKQKELIAQSIKETKTLFNSRMDYYFN